MNDGTSFGFYGKLLRFNGGLFAEARAFELTAEQLWVLLTAAKREWKDVEPAIFGTLLERAFNNKALVSMLKQIHDELDAAVFEAYGWSDLLDPPNPP
jgi:hypothetical protein